jgi:hypothetical protein
LPGQECERDLRNYVRAHEIQVVASGGKLKLRLSRHVELLIVRIGKLCGIYFIALIASIPETKRTRRDSFEGGFGHLKQMVP